MKKLSIIVDSFSGLSKKEYEKMGLEYLNQIAIIDGEVFREGIDGVLVDVIDKILAARDHKTSMPAVGLVMDKFEELSKNNDYVIFLPMNKGMSSTYSTAMAASNNFENVDVINTKFSGLGVVHYAVNAIKMFNEGESISDVKKYILDGSENSITYLLPRNLDQLVKSGRLSGAKKFIMKKGKLIPRLYLTNDGIVVKGVRRNFTKAIGSSIDKIFEKISEESKDDYIWEIIHSTGDDSIKTAEKELKIRGITKYNIIPCSASTAAHTGKGTVAINAYKK